MNILNRLKSTLLFSMIGLAVACSDNEETPTPFNINFTNTELGVSSSITSTDVSIIFSRAAEIAGSVDISLSTGNLNYGIDADFYTTPEMLDGVVTIPYEKDAEGFSFTINAGSSLNIQQDETITMAIADNSENFVLGQNTSLTVTFSENFIAPSGIIELNGGGPDYPNQAFVDLSKLEQNTVDKYSWDLGFYNISGQHKVVLNNSAYVMARALDKANIDEVVVTDTTGFASDMIVSNYINPAASNWIDHQNGDLSQTAIGNISTTDSENKVFIIKRDGDGRNWKKVRILHNGDNYTLQYADIDASTHTSVTVSKDDSYNFSFFDLDNGAAAVEPEKGSWDIMYGTYANRVNYGSILAVGFNDFIIINREKVSATIVSNDDFSYQDFSADDLSSVTLINNDISIIGSSWRELVDYSLVLKTGVFYVIKDGENNTYKLKFNRLESTTGERGYPEFSFELIQ